MMLSAGCPHLQVVAVTRHLGAFPEDGLAAALENVIAYVAVDALHAQSNPRAHTASRACVLAQVRSF